MADAIGTWRIPPILFHINFRINSGVRVLTSLPFLASYEGIWRVVPYEGIKQNMNKQKVVPHA